MKTIHILQTADEVINAFNPNRVYGDESPWVGVDAKLDFREVNPLINCETCEIRGVSYDDIVKAALDKLHIRLSD